MHGFIQKDIIGINNDLTKEWRNPFLFERIANEVNFMEC